MLNITINLKQFNLEKFGKRETTKLCYCPLSTKSNFVTFGLSLPFKVIKIHIN